MWDSETGYFHICLGFLAYHFLLAHGCTYLVRIIACMNSNDTFFTPIGLQKVVLALISTGAVTSIPYTLFLVALAFIFLLCLSQVGLPVQ